MQCPTGILQSPIMTCRSMEPINKLRCNLYLRMGSHALPVEQARLGRLACPGICADASSSPPGLLGMSGIAFLIALILMIFGLNTGSLNVLSFLYSTWCHAFPHVESEVCLCSDLVIISKGQT